MPIVTIGCQSTGSYNMTSSEEENMKTHTERVFIPIIVAEKHRPPPFAVSNRQKGIIKRATTVDAMQ